MWPNRTMQTITQCILSVIGKQLFILEIKAYLHCRSSVTSRLSGVMTPQTNNNLYMGEQEGQCGRVLPTHLIIKASV